MPLFYQHTINGLAKLGVWYIDEPEIFFLKKVPLKRDITHWHKRLQHLAGRYLLQELYPQFPHHLIEIADTRKPFLPNEEYHFSISHCGDYAAVIVSENERVGVDIELITPKAEKIKHKFLKGEEFDIVAELQVKTNFSEEKILTSMWCIKEAMFKWYGEGNIDFKEHLQIKNMEWKQNSGIVDCCFLKEDEIKMKGEFIFIESNCLCWIIT